MDTIGNAFPNSDYSFVDSASLDFVDSKSCIGIQVADCIAGYLMRFARDFLSATAQTEEINYHIFNTLAATPEDPKGCGINLVMTSRHARDIRDV